MVLESDELVEFATYNFSKMVEDDIDVFLNVACIRDAML